MRFRSLRIDYRAEAIEVLREERQLRQQRKEERRRDNDGNTQCDDSSISISHQSRPRKKRRVIRIFHEALEPEPEQRWHKPEQERDRNDNKKEAVLRLPFWISTHVNNDSNKDSLAVSDTKTDANHYPKKINDNDYEHNEYEHDDDTTMVNVRDNCKVFCPTIRNYNDDCAVSACFI